MNDWKLILKVMFGCVILVAIMIYGLTKMAKDPGGLKVDLTTLVSGARLVKENGETKVTVVNFSDMECPACKNAHGQLSELTTKPGVKMVFRHFPLQIHKNAQNGAKAVEAAMQMGKGWEMIDLLFEKQSVWSSDPKVVEVLTGYAKSLGLSEKEFLDRFNSKETEAAIATDQALADSLKLNGTPTIFVNGEQVATDFVTGKVNELLKTN